MNTINGSRKAKLEFKGVHTESVPKTTENVHPKKDRSSFRSNVSDIDNHSERREEQANSNTNTPTSQGLSVLKARRKSLQDMRQSSSNLLVNNNNEVSHFWNTHVLISFHSRM